MSSRAENWAWERDDVKGITKFVLVYLARRAYYDDGAAAWPSVETIAFNCGCCERTVIRSLQELERKGYIRPGDQEMSARNPRTRKPIAKGHRSRVWDVIMDGDRPVENIEERPGTWTRWPIAKTIPKQTRTICHPTDRHPSRRAWDRGQIVPESWTESHPIDK